MSFCSDPECHANVTPSAVVNVQSGDRILLAFRRDLSDEQASEMRLSLTKRFPDVEFTFACCVTAVVRDPA